MASSTKMQQNAISNEWYSSMANFLKWNSEECAEDRKRLGRLLGSALLSFWRRDGEASPSSSDCISIATPKAKTRTASLFQSVRGKEDDYVNESLSISEFASSLSSIDTSSSSSSDASSSSSSDASSTVSESSDVEGVADNLPQQRVDTSYNSETRFSQLGGDVDSDLSQPTPVEDVVCKGSDVATSKNGANAQKIEICAAMLSPSAQQRTTPSSVGNLIVSESYLHHSVGEELVPAGTPLGEIEEENTKLHSTPEIKEVKEELPHDGPFVLNCHEAARVNCNDSFQDAAISGRNTFISNVTGSTASSTSAVHCSGVSSQSYIAQRKAHAASSEDYKSTVSVSDATLSKFSESKMALNNSILSISSGDGRELSSMSSHEFVNPSPASKEPIRRKINFLDDVRFVGLSSKALPIGNLQPNPASTSMASEEGLHNSKRKKYIRKQVPQDRNCQPHSSATGRKQRKSNREVYRCNRAAPVNYLGSSSARQYFIGDDARYGSILNECEASLQPMPVYTSGKRNPNTTRTIKTEEENKDEGTVLPVALQKSIADRLTHTERGATQQSQTDPRAAQQSKRESGIDREEAKIRKTRQVKSKSKASCKKTLEKKATNEDPLAAARTTIPFCLPPSSCPTRSSEEIGSILDGLLAARPLSSAAANSFAPSNSESAATDEASQQKQPRKKRRTAAAAERHQKKWKEIQERRQQFAKKAPTPRVSTSVPNICRMYFKTAVCRKGEQCPFSHACIPETKSILCNYFVQHTCTRGDGCPYSHDCSAFLCRYKVFRGECTKQVCPFEHTFDALNLTVEQKWKFVQTNRRFLHQMNERRKIEEQQGAEKKEIPWFFSFYEQMNNITNRRFLERQNNEDVSTEARTVESPFYSANSDSVGRAHNSITR